MLFLRDIRPIGTRFSKKERAAFRRLEANFEERARTPERSSRFFELIRKRVGPYGILKAGIPVAAEWRSRAIVPNILRIPDWKPADLVIGGSAHAVNIAGLPGGSVDIVVGRYHSPSDAKREIEEVMVGQRELSARLEMARRWQRRLNSFFGLFRKVLGRGH